MSINVEKNKLYAGFRVKINRMFKMNKGKKSAGNKIRTVLLLSVFISLLTYAFLTYQSPIKRLLFSINRSIPTFSYGQAIADTPSPSKQAFLSKFSEAAVERTRHQVTYDSTYVILKYPGGDVPPDKGVCTDVIIRAYRKMGIDLQKDIHEDMRTNFPKYPKIWGLKGPDRNIDHRRVPNLMVLFERKGKKLPVSNNPKDYLPGEIVTWRLGGGATHIGIVAKDHNFFKTRPLLVHNLHQGPQMEDVLFNWKIIGHYRYFGSNP